MIEKCVYCGKEAEYLGMDIYGPCHRDCFNKRVYKDRRNLLLVSMSALIILMIVLQILSGGQGVSL